MKIKQLEAIYKRMFMQHEQKPGEVCVFNPGNNEVYKFSIADVVRELRGGGCEDIRVDDYGNVFIPLQDHKKLQALLAQARKKR